MKNFFILLIVLPCMIFLISYSKNIYAKETRYNIHEIAYDNKKDIFYSKKTKKLLHGTLFLYYPSKILRATISFVNGAQEGNMQLYNIHGVLTAKIPYRNGSINGISFYYNEDGSIREQISYKSGIKHGLMMRYFTSGKIQQEIPIVNNIINGTVILYRENSRILAKLTYTNGKPSKGVCYSERGNPLDLSSAELYNWENGIPFSCFDIPQAEY